MALDDVTVRAGRTMRREESEESENERAELK